MCFGNARICSTSSAVLGTRSSPDRGFRALLTESGASRVGEGLEAVLVVFATIDDVGSILGTATWCTRATGSMFADAEGEHGMKIKWYGHACFRIEGGGVSIVTDPYTPEVAGLDPVEEPADVVIMSSATDRFHSNAPWWPAPRRS